MIIKGVGFSNSWDNTQHFNNFTKKNGTREKRTNCNNQQQTGNQ
jgi:hypothetical protein